MVHNSSVLRIWRISRIEYYKWIINPRMIIVVAMIIFIWNFAVFPLINISREMNSPLNTLEPFIAILNSRVLCLLTPSVYLFLIADYPHLDHNSLFVLHRIRKIEWVLSQFIFLFYHLLRSWEVFFYFQLFRTLSTHSLPTVGV